MTKEYFLIDTTSGNYIANIAASGLYATWILSLVTKEVMLSLENAFMFVILFFMMYRVVEYYLTGRSKSPWPFLTGEVYEGANARRNNFLHLSGLIGLTVAVLFLAQG